MPFFSLCRFRLPRSLPLQASESRGALLRAFGCHARYLTQDRLARSWLAAACVSGFGVVAAAAQLRSLFHALSGPSLWVGAIYVGGLLALLAMFCARIGMGWLRGEPRTQGRTALGDEMAESWRAARGAWKAEREASELSAACEKPVGSDAEPFSGRVGEPRPSRKPRRL